MPGTLPPTQPRFGLKKCIIEYQPLWSKVHQQDSTYRRIPEYVLHEAVDNHSEGIYLLTNKPKINYVISMVIANISLYPCEVPAPYYH